MMAGGGILNFQDIKTEGQKYNQDWGGDFQDKVKHCMYRCRFENMEEKRNNKNCKRANPLLKNQRLNICINKETIEREKKKSH